MMDPVLNSGMCRCCASEGTFKNVMSKYHWMGDEEIYADMLRECFDITLCSSDGGLQSGICEVCITQLRNAANFKKQVQQTEEQFKKRLQDNMFKANIVKLEMGTVEDDDGNLSDNNLSEDFVAEFEVPIKKESEEPKSKKRGSTRASTSRAKKPKLEDGESSAKSVGSEPNSVSNIKANTSILMKLLSKNARVEHVSHVDILNLCNKRAPVKYNYVPHKKITSRDLKGNQRELEKHLHNSKQLLLHTNATPIRRHFGVYYHCCFCSESFVQAIDLKAHNLHSHGDRDIVNFMRNSSLSKFVVKIDITALQCSICSDNLETLDQAMDHLSLQHDIAFFHDIKNRILTFKFDGDSVYCAVCSNVFERFKLAHVHMSYHYSNYTCETCHANFVTRQNVTSHAKRHEQEESACSFCPKLFENPSKKFEHERLVHKGMNRRVCPLCNEVFSNHKKKTDHMTLVHGMQPKVYQCTTCDQTYTCRSGLSNHIKKDHLMERNHACPHCDKKFFASQSLKKHLLKHTGVRSYKCEVCCKSYARKNTLREHMRIHNDDRRFQCDLCKLSFVYKCSLKNHMRSRHGYN